MSPLVRSRLQKAREEGSAHFVEVLAEDVRLACEALPADEVTHRLLGVCAKVIPSRTAKKRNEPPAARVWLAAADVEHLLREVT